MTSNCCSVEMEAVVMTVLLAWNGRRRQVEVVYMCTCYPLTQDELSCLGRDLCQHNKPYQNVEYQNVQHLSALFCEQKLLLWGSLPMPAQDR